MFSLNQLKNLYYNSPLWVQNIYASIPFDIRQGGEYRKWKKFLESEVDPDEYKILKMKEVVAYAYHNTIYYKKLFNEMGASPHDINDYKDFQQIPLVDKIIVRENFEDFLVKDYPKRKIISVVTGGTTGTPMRFFQSKNIWSKETAFYMNLFSQYGYKPTLLKAAFRGGRFNKLEDGKYCIYNPVNNEIWFSPSYLNKNTIDVYIQTLNRMRPLYIHGFASAILMLMYNMKQKNLHLAYSLKAIFLVSESFSERDIELLKNFFNCSIVVTYGHSERLVFARSSETKLGIDGYLIYKKYGLFELIDSTKRTIDLNRISGEIVGTGFDNYAMPLIRYKTGDFTEYIDHEMNKIALVTSNRNQEYIDGKNGIKISFPSLMQSSEMEKLKVFKYQIMQSKPGECQVLIIPNTGFDNNCKEKLMKSLKNKVGSSLDCHILIVDKLKITKKNKCKLLIKEYNTNTK